MSLHSTLIAAEHDTDSLVVFLHGLFGQGKNFTAVARSLTASHPRLGCLLVDLPNHGRSDWTTSLDQAEWADQVSGAVTALAAEQGLPNSIQLVGHSLGGKVAMQMALRHPDLVEQLVVVDISPVASDQVQKQFAGLVAAMSALEITSLSSRAEAETKLSTGIPDPVVRAFLMQNLRHDRMAPPGSQWRWQMNLALLGADLDQVGAWSVEPDQRYDGPVTWIAGGRSPYIRAEHEPAMRSLFPQARKVTVKEAGHWVHSEQPAIFAGILSRLLGDS